MNKLIDSISYPLARSHERMLFLDGALHALVEKKNAFSSARKFLMYNVREVLSKAGASDR